MCPFCFASVGLIVAGTISIGGLAAIAVGVSRKEHKAPDVTQITNKRNSRDVEVEE
jgi:hypothetical protein